MSPFLALTLLFPLAHPKGPREMSSGGISGFNLLTLKNLCDKAQEKRKSALVDIERYVCEMTQCMNFEPVKELLKKLVGEYILSNHSALRKGGLCGIASATIGLGKSAHLYMDIIVPPVIGCFSDQDGAIRFAACESMFNISKVLRGHTLVYLKEIFTLLTLLVVDSDQLVRDGANIFMVLIMDIISEASVKEMTTLVPLIRQHMYPVNVACKNFIVTWISFLNKIPSCECLTYLPEFLDGLLMICYEKNRALHQRTKSLLDDFLEKIVTCPEKVEVPLVLNILILHSQSKDEQVKLIALNWLNKVISVSRSHTLRVLPSIFNMVLPSLCSSGHSSPVFNLAQEIERKLRAFLGTIESEEELTAINCHLDWEYFIGLLESFLRHPNDCSKTTVMYWLLELLDVHYGKVYLRFFLFFQSHPTRGTLLNHHQVYHHISLLFDTLLQNLNESSQSVVLLAFQVLSKIIAYRHPECPNLPGEEKVGGEPEGGGASSAPITPHFDRFVQGLLSNLLSENGKQLSSQGAFIIREACNHLDNKCFYTKVSKFLMADLSNPKLISSAVNHFNTILLTATELEGMRMLLRSMRTPSDTQLFQDLYHCWAYNPAATLSLCFLAGQYEHAWRIVQSFEWMKLSVDLLLQLDHLVHIIESPNFTFLRLHLLLRTTQGQSIRSALHGLLMVLPQGPAFTVLKKRLKCINELVTFSLDHRNGEERSSESMEPDSAAPMSIPYQSMLEHFRSIHCTL